MPKNYQEIASKNILTEDELKQGKVRYNDKVLHQSKIIKYFIENENQKNTKRYR